MQSSLFDQEPSVKLTLDLLKGIDLTIYPPHRLHFLVYALQKGLKPPSQSSMRRIEIRNARKSGISNAKSNLSSIISLAKSFSLPKKFGAKVTKPKFPSTGWFGLSKPKYVRIRRPARVVPNKQISLPSQVKMITRGKRIPKRVRIDYWSHSPQQLVEKAARQKFCQQIQNYYALKGIKFDTTGTKKKQVSAYFRRKKANQHRRRRQKHLLIQSNRTALAEIFGDAIFQRGWPVSRKQIKLALGIKQKDHMKPQFLREFMEMAQSMKQPISFETSKSSASKTSQISRMLSRVQIKDYQIQSTKNKLNVLVVSPFASKAKPSVSKKLDQQFPSIQDFYSKKSSKK